MPRSNGTGRIHLLDHQAPQPTKAEQQAAEMRQMAASIEQIAEAKALHVVQFFVQQIPGIVATMIGQILHANGMELKPPPEWAALHGFRPEAPDASEPTAPQDSEPTDAEGAE